MRGGDVIGGRFELASVAGGGGMGVVWRARDRETGDEVAVKCLRRAGEEETTRFVREARVLRGLSHPGIVRHVADGVSAEGEPWLAMEWLRGEDLAARLGRARLTGTEALAVGVGIAEALGFAHAEGLVHRDLKPSNVWLVEGDPTRVKLLDFGLVRRTDPAMSLGRTRAGALLGTPGYMAPEQARGERTVDARADLFSLGCVLFECVAGRPVFVGEHALALLAKVLLEPAPRLSSVVEVPRALDELVGRLLAKEPADRVSSAEEALRALRGIGGVDAFAWGAATVAASAESFGREQRWVCVLLIDRAAPSAKDPSGHHGMLSVARRAEESGARVEALAGGARIVLWETSGSPVELAQRAARAALAVHEEDPDRSLGLASGRAALDGEVPVGAALERAAACAAQSGGVIAVDPSVARLLGEGFDCAPRGDVYVLRGERATDGSDRTLLGRPSPCVGREVELSTLNLTLREAIDDRAATAALLVGELGVGKSRIVHEWLRTLRAEQPEVAVWRARADVIHEGAAFGVAAQWVRDASGVAMGATREQVRGRILSAVSATVAEAERTRVGSRLCELCGVAWDEGEVDTGLRTARRDPIVMGDQLRAAWEDFLAGWCADRAVVLVVDDVHRVDASSVALVDRALRNLAGLPWMVVGAGRPEVHERHPRLWAERNVRELRVGPLKDRAAERLVRAALGAVHDGGRVRALVQRAGGNAYLLEELIRAEAEGLGDRTPESVLAMVESRLLRLDPGSRRVLRAASVFGGRIDARGVAAVLDAPSSKGALDALTGQEWLEALDGGGYAFRQETTREAAYAMLVDEDRRLAHERAAAWLASADEPDAASVAAHHERAGSEASASRWWVRAARQAFEANDFPATVARAEAAERCGAQGARLGEALAIRADAGMWAGDLRGPLEAARRALALDGIAVEHELAALRVNAMCAGRLSEEGDFAGIVARLDSLLRERSELDEVLDTALRIARILRAGGHPEPAARLAARVERVEPGIAERSLTVQATDAAWRAFLAAFDDNPAGCVRQERRAIALYEQSGDLRRAANERINEGWALVLLGAYADAERILRSSVVECRRIGIAPAEASAWQNLGVALSCLGAHEDAVEAEQASIDFGVRVGASGFECSSRGYLARALLAAGRIEEALSQATRAERQGDEVLGWPHFARAIHADALLARDRGSDRADALALARGTREVLRRDAGRFEERAPILRVFIEALEANGLWEEAARERREARAWLLARAERIDDAGWRESFLRAVPDHAKILGEGAVPRDDG